jgi:hypothetical protein
MFVFLNSNAARDDYIEGHPSLTGRVMFTNSALLAHLAHVESRIARHQLVMSP